MINIEIKGHNFGSFFTSDERLCIKTSFLANSGIIYGCTVTAFFLTLLFINNVSSIKYGFKMFSDLDRHDF